MNDRPAHPAKGLLVLVPLAGTVVLLLAVIGPWMVRLDLLDRRLAAVCWFSSVIWLLVLWWSFHHLVFQVASLLAPGAGRGVAKEPRAGVRFAVLYVTCDDFQGDACLSCITQDYQGPYRVLIGDDGTEEAYRQRITAFRAEHPEVEVVRRADRRGFKAGNLNHLLGRVDEEWFVVIDADQVLPTGYLSTLAAVVAGVPAEVAFVQGGHLADHLRLGAGGDGAGDAPRAATAFQDALGCEIQLFYNHDLTWRQRHGFLPFLGHGAAIRRSAWEEVGGFPEVVSEDYAFSMALAAAGFHGVYAEDVVSWESFPRDFSAFVLRLRKFAGGSAELARSRLTWRFLKGFFGGWSAFVERLDFLLLLSWYPLMPLVLVNIVLSGWVCHALWQRRIEALHPVLPYVFVALFLLPLPPLLAVAGHPIRAVRAWFWSSAIYTASLPVAAERFLTRLVAPARFERTPKGHSPSPRFLGTGALLVVLGAGLLAQSWLWWSPFSPVQWGYGSAFVFFPLYRWLHERGWRGWLARPAVLVPGACFVYALYTMWWWGTF